MRRKLRLYTLPKPLPFITPAIACIFVLTGLNLPWETKNWQSSPEEPSVSGISNVTESTQPMESGQSSDQAVTVQDGLIFIKAGSFAMGSPEDEPCRSAAEIQHTVTWDRSANGYRLPKGAEWEYACLLPRRWTFWAEHDDDYQVSS